MSVHADLAGMLRAGRSGRRAHRRVERHASRLHRRAGAAGIPILCEKPCGLSSRQGREAAAIAAAAKVPLQVAYWRRFVPSLKTLKTRIVAGELGDLYLAACYQWDEQPPPASFRSRSGGIFMDMAVHEFDQIRWLTGQEIGALHAVAARTLSEPPVPGDAESAQVLCALSGGATGLVSLGRRFPLGDVCKVEVFGTRGARGMPLPLAADGRADLPRGAAAPGGELRALGRRRACRRGERARRRRRARGRRARLADIPERRGEALMPGLPEVRIGIVGYGMMGKAHSYGYREAPRLRDLPVRPRLRLISGRRRELVEKAAAAYGVEEIDDRLAPARRAQGHRHRRYLHAARDPCRDRRCGRRGGQGRDLREALRHLLRRRQGRPRGRAPGRRAECGRLQLSAPAGRLADEAHDRRRRHRPAAALARLLALRRVRRPRRSRSTGASTGGWAERPSPISAAT